MLSTTRSTLESLGYFPETIFILEMIYGDFDCAFNFFARFKNCITEYIASIYYIN